jgi:hypothetical protein
MKIGREGEIQDEEVNVEVTILEVNQINASSSRDMTGRAKQTLK